MQDHAIKTFVQDSWQTPRNARTLAAYMALQNREIGERIATLRRAKGSPPQEIVAQRLEVANRSYQSWEAGDTKPSWRNLTKLAKFYGVSEEYILMGDGPVDAPPPSQMDRIEADVAALRADLAQLLGLMTGNPERIASLSDAILRAVENAMSQRAREAGLRGRARPKPPPVAARPPAA